MASMQQKKNSIRTQSLQIFELHLSFLLLYIKRYPISTLHHKLSLISTGKQKWKTQPSSTHLFLFSFSFFLSISCFSRELPDAKISLLAHLLYPFSATFTSSNHPCTGFYTIFRKNTALLSPSDSAPVSLLSYHRSKLPRNASPRTISFSPTAPDF